MIFLKNHRKDYFKIWELALTVGLLAGLLCSPADAASLPLSRFQTEQTVLRYEVSLFPFGFREAEQPTAVQLLPEVQPEYEVKFKVLEWWEELFG